MKRRFILLAILVLASVTLAGCSTDLTGSAYEKHYIKDEKTGVNYVLINSNSGVTICPRYNSDGSLYVSK